ncbi:MAG TPA: ATP-binding protein [Alphaproteobacteria bacterium]
MLPQLLLAPERSSSEPTRAGALAIQVPPVLPDATCGDVYDWLMATPDAPGVVVVSESTAPLGLVSRHSAVTRYAERYGPELYGRRPIAALMDDRPLTVDESTLINELGRQVAVDHPAALVHGFVVTANGLYRGIGTGQALIRAKVERDARQALELQAAVAESARARQAMSDFLAMMSHELRTPLNAIIGFSDVMQREQFGPLGGARYVEYARDINGAGTHLLALISDILDLSKAQAGRLEIRPGPVSVAHVVAACLSLTAQRSQHAGLTVGTEVADRLPLLEADELKLKQMLLNLLTNAIKFTRPGGSIKVTAGMADGEMVIRVGDTGIGIAAEDIPTALAPFGQIDSQLARATEGTGLGLPLVRVLTELHGGRFVLDSIVGQGTTVSLFFPPQRVIGHELEQQTG